MTDFQLNPEQTETLERLSNFQNIYVLKGYAGTGKTTVITRWVRQIRTKPVDWPQGKYWRKPEIVLTAPTNKAVGVLEEKVDEINLPVDTKTIHSLLGLKLKWDKGEQVLVQDPRGANLFGEYDYVVVDECSMLDSQLMQYLNAAVDSHSNKLIFMGDPCQLPPIGEEISESFNASEEVSELKTIMRQAGENPIPHMGAYLRELILSGARAYPARLFTFVDDKHIIHKPASAFQDEVLEAFVAEQDRRDIRHLAWTNKVVDSWNDKIRDRLYGTDRDEWTKGEQIVTTAPVIDKIESRVVFSTDTLLTIQREPELVEREDIPCWKLWVRNQIIYVPTKGSGKLFSDKKNALIAAAKVDKRKWRAFYEFMETFSSVKPAHSLTVHRSQGSTFDDVYVSYQNILANPRRKESLQCLYVAITRPRGRLILV